MSCCFVTSVQLAASANTQPNGKDIAIDDLPTVDRSIAQSIADALGLGDIFQGVLDFLSGIKNTNDKILETKTPDWNIVKDAIEDNDTRGKELGRQLENRDTDSFISNQLAESFQTIWDGVIFNTNSSFWKAVIAGGLDFALLGMILYAWEGFKVEENKRQPYTINGIVMVIILSILLGGNGLLTSNILRITHSFGQNLTRTLANTQILDLTIADSLANISLSNNARDEVNRLLGECNELTGDEALQCREKQVPEIQKIADAAEANDPIAQHPAAKYAKGILSYLQECRGRRNGRSRTRLSGSTSF